MTSLPLLENLLQAKKDNYWHLITNEGNQIDSNVYRHIFETGGHYFKAQLPNHKWIFIDSTGEQVLDQELDKIEFNKNCECYLVNADSIASILTDRLVLEIGFKAEKLFRTDNSRYYIFILEKITGCLIRKEISLFLQSINGATWLKTQVWSSFNKMG